MTNTSEDTKGTLSKQFSFWWCLRPATFRNHYWRTHHAKSIELRGAKHTQIRTVTCMGIGWLRQNQEHSPGTYRRGVVLHAGVRESTSELVTSEVKLEGRKDSIWYEAGHLRQMGWFEQGHERLGIQSNGT